MAQSERSKRVPKNGSWYIKKKFRKKCWFWRFLILTFPDYDYSNRNNFPILTFLELSRLWLRTVIDHARNHRLPDSISRARPLESAERVYKTRRGTVRNRSRILRSVPRDVLASTSDRVAVAAVWSGNLLGRPIADKNAIFFLQSDAAALYIYKLFKTGGSRPRWRRSIAREPRAWLEAALGRTHCYASHSGSLFLPRFSFPLFWPPPFSSAR